VATRYTGRALWANGPPQPDPVTKDDLHRTIGFVKELVKATDEALAT
jgi:hypothetical protein